MPTPKKPPAAGAKKPRASGPVEPQIVSSKAGQETLEATVGLIRALQNKPHESRRRTSLSVVCDQLGLDAKRRKAFLYHDKGTKSDFSISEIERIVEYAQNILKAEDLDPTAAETIANQCGLVVRSLFKSVGLVGSIFREYTFFQYLGLKAEDQDELGRDFAGVYLLLRLDTDFAIVASRLQIRPKQPGAYLCRFDTSLSATPVNPAPEPESEPDLTPVADGYAYRSGAYMHTIGMMDTHVLRYSILQDGRAAGLSEDDLYGLRLYKSSDHGILAQRIYCRRLDPAMPEGAITDLLTRIPSNAQGPLRALVPDLDEVIEALRRLSPKLPPGAGLTIPELVREQ